MTWTEACLQVGIVPGKMAKICPHTSTGRADYFGSAVNRAARLLCAAQGGQVLIEEHVMDSIVTEWRGDGGAPKSCPWVKGVGSPDGKQSLALAMFDRLAGRPAGRPGGKSLSVDDSAELQKRSASVPLNQIRRWALGRAAAPAAAQSPDKFGLGLPAALQDAASIGSSRDSTPRPEDLEEAYCSPFASHSPLAVSNCHMLAFLKSSGPLSGRKESGVLMTKAYRGFIDKKIKAGESSRQLLASAGNSLDPNYDPPAEETLPSSDRLPSPRTKGLVIAPKVAWSDGIAIQIAKKEQQMDLGSKKGRNHFHFGSPVIFLHFVSTMFIVMHSAWHVANCSA